MIHAHAFRTRRARDVRATSKIDATRRVVNLNVTGMLHHARVRENALMTPVLSTRNVSLTLILTSKRSNA